MLFTEAKKFLNSKGYELEESLGLSVESVVNYIGKNYDFKPGTVTVQGNDISVFDTGESLLKVVEGDDGSVYLTFLNDAGVPNGGSVKVSSFEDIDANL